MVTRFLARGLSLFLFGAMLGACAEPTGTTGTPAPTQTAISAEEAQLNQLSAAMRRTLKEGVAVGIATASVGTGFLGNDKQNQGGGIRFGARAGLAAGSYVAAVQQRYLTQSARLEKIRTDAEATNALAAQANTAMASVLSDHRAKLAQLRAQNAAAEAPDLGSEVSRARGNLATMNSTIAGAEGRLGELSETRSIVSPASAQGGIDPQIDELSRRITEMRQIAEDLAGLI